MDLTRRDACKAAAALAVAGAPAAATDSAASDVTRTAIMDFTGGVEPRDGGVDLGVPEVAEYGGAVPLDVRAEGATAIMIFADGNPGPSVATFHFGPLAGASFASTRVRLAQTQHVIAVARMADGTFARATRKVEVIVGGCNG